MGVRGVDYGVLYTDGRATRHFGLRFHVERKQDIGALAPDQRLPRELLGFRCDVVQAKYVPHADLAARLMPRNPVPPGVSIGNVAHTTGGTLGGFVRDRVAGSTMLISNWHVLCGSKSAVVGENISQPGPRHLGTNPPNVIATLERWSDLDHGYDAAVALLRPSVRPDFTDAVNATAEPVVGMRVVKRGATSGLTHGRIDGIDGSYLADYSLQGDRSRWMDGFRIVPDPDHAEEDEISLGGDSGSIWTEATGGAAVGLHFAGEDGLGPTAEYALAHRVSRVLDLLRVELMGGGT